MEIAVSGHETVGDILSSAIPREFLLNLERFVPEALERALKTGLMAAPGHRKSLTGHSRHFFLNEALMSSFEETGIDHPPLKGNAVMVGNVSLVAIARVHMNQGKWDNSRRSKAKRKLCEPNQLVASLVQLPLLLTEEQPPIEAVTVFIVTEGDGSADGHVPIYIVVPDHNMDLRHPVFVEPLSIFMQRYQQVQDVVDNAQPTLKAGVKREEEKPES